jgi:hypothetical protein
MGMSGNRGPELAGKREYPIEMSLLNLFALLLMFGSDTYGEFAYPPNAVSGGTVVAELHSVSGSGSDAKIISGSEPFVSSTKATLQNWNLHPEKDGADLVVVHFRQPNLFYVGDSGEEIRCAKADRSLPCPRYVVGPAYPTQSLSQGSVVLKVEIGENGAVMGVRTLKAMGVLTDVSVEAVRKWKFIPAEDSSGAKKPSQAYAVFVYRFPVTQEKR